MEEHKRKICPAVWFSGFFGLGAFVHLARLLFRVPLIVGTFEVPLKASLILGILLGGLSVGLLYIGYRRPCCRKESKGLDT